MVHSPTSCLKFYFQGMYVRQSFKDQCMVICEALISGRDATNCIESEGFAVTRVNS